MRIPGIGPVTAVRFVATIDEPGRFSSAHRVQSYLGHMPGEHSSSERNRRTGDHQGRFDGDAPHADPGRLGNDVPRSHVASDDRLGPAAPERRGRPVAAVALARKLAGIMFAMWRDGTTYQAKRSAEAIERS
jgi:transposase